MIYEIASLTIDPADAEAFEAAVRGCIPHFRGAAGCRSMRLERVIEEPGAYRLVVGWNTVEDHMVGFRESDAFTAWRAAVGPFFTAPPHVVHVEEAVSGF